MARGSNMEQREPPDVRVIRPVDSREEDRHRELQCLLDEALDVGSVRIALDMSSGIFPSATSLGILVRALKRAREGGGDLRVFSAPPEWAEVLRRVQLDSIFPLHVNEQDAISSFRESPRPPPASES